MVALAVYLAYLAMGDDLEVARTALTTVTPATTSSDAAAPAAPAPEAGGNFTGTYTQEQDVDEFDARTIIAEFDQKVASEYPGCNLQGATVFGPRNTVLDSILNQWLQ